MVQYQVTITEDRQNLNLTEELSEEVPGILNWALIGLQRLYERGFRFIEPQVCIDLKEEHRQDSNPVREFLADHVQEAEGVETRTTFMYEAYREWARENGYTPLNERNFGKEVVRAFGQRRKQKRNGRARYWVYVGLELVRCGLLPEFTDSPGTPEDDFVTMRTDYMVTKLVN